MMNKREIDEVFKKINNGNTLELSKIIKNKSLQTQLTSKENLEDFGFYEVEPIIARTI